MDQVLKGLGFNSKFLKNQNNPVTNQKQLEWNSDSSEVSGRCCWWWSAGAGLHTLHFFLVIWEDSQISALWFLFCFVERIQDW